MQDDTGMHRNASCVHSLLLLQRAGISLPE
jgi:hypothetical protein